MYSQYIDVQLYQLTNLKQTSLKLRLAHWTSRDRTSTLKMFEKYFDGWRADAMIWLHILNLVKVSKEVEKYKLGVEQNYLTIFGFFRAYLVDLIKHKDANQSVINSFITWPAIDTMAGLEKYLDHYGIILPSYDAVEDGIRLLLERLLLFRHVITSIDSGQTEKLKWKQMSDKDIYLHTGVLYESIVPHFNLLVRKPRLESFPRKFIRKDGQVGYGTSDKSLIINLVRDNSTKISIDVEYLRKYYARWTGNDRKCPDYINLKGLRDTVGPKLEHAYKGKQIIYVGRAMNQGGWRLPNTIWLNPYKVDKDGTIQEVLKMYEKHFYTQKLDDHLYKLDGKTIACWCKPNPCHCTVIIKAWQEKFG